LIAKRSSKMSLTANEHAREASSTRGPGRGTAAYMPHPQVALLSNGGWPGYEVAYRHGSANYRIWVENPDSAGRGVRSVLLDGQPMPGGVVPFRDDGREHGVRVSLGNRTR
jgi:hypothetical protein